MSYKIIIEKEITGTRLDRKPWVVVKKGIGQVPDEMGYAPSVEQPFTDRVEIYTQVVGDLDLVAVISAVNKANGDGN